MRKKLFTLLLLLCLLPSFHVNAQNDIKKFTYDFEDGSLQGISGFKGAYTFPYTDVSQGANIYTEKRDDGTSYLKLDIEKAGNPSLAVRFPETLKGKVVVEADILIDNLTPTRNLFELINTNQKTVVRLNSYQYYYQLCYGNTTLEINEIPLNAEWHHYMAVINTNTNKFYFYIDGRPVMGTASETLANTDASGGIIGFKTAVLARNLPGFKNGSTCIDNITAYALSDTEIEDFTSDIYDIDYTYKTIENVKMGTVVSEFLSGLKLNNTAACITDINGKEKDGGKFLSPKDTLVLTRGSERSFYSIRLDKLSEFNAVFSENSPELFINGERDFFSDNTASVIPAALNGEIYVPVRSAQKLFNAEVTWDGINGVTTVTADGKTLSFKANDSGFISINGRGYALLSEICDFFGYKLFEKDGLYILNKEEIPNLSENTIKFFKESFVFKNDGSYTIECAGDIEKAVNEAKELIKNGYDGDIVIKLTKDEYYLENPIVFDEDFSRENQNRIIISGNESKKTKITGGKKLINGDFKPISDSAVKDRLSSLSKNKVLEYDLKKLGITDAGEITSQGHTFEIKPSEIVLYSGSEPLTPARYPNDGYLYSGRAVNQGWGWSASGNGNNEFEYTDKRCEDWKEDENIWAFGFWNDEYSPGNARVAKFDKENKTVVLDGIIRAGITKSERPYYYYNVLEELDREGEYYIDKKTLMLYVYPKTDGGDYYVSVSENPLMLFNGTNGITVENVEFSYVRDYAVKETNTKNMLIKNCDFIGVGTYGIIQRETENCGLYGCYFYKTGAHSAMIEGGDLTTLTSGRNFVISSKFRETGFRRRTYSGSILSRGVGNYIYKNRIQDNFHMGVYVFGSEHVIKNNSFYNICYQSGDAGAVYMYARWSTANIKVIGNSFQKMKSVPEVYALGNIGVYYDNSTSNTVTYGNLFYDLVNGVQSNCGMYNKISGNIFSDITNTAAILAANGLQQAIYDTVNTVPYKGNIWRREVPRLYELMANYNPLIAKGTEAYDNAVDNTPDFQNSDPKTIKTYDNISDTLSKEELFMNKTERDFRLKNPAYYENTYKEGEVDYFAMGVNNDFSVSEDKTLDRLFMFTDISPSSKANIYLETGKSVSAYVKARSLDGNVKPVSDIKFKSDNENIASVSDGGTITAKSGGKACVTAEAYIDGEKRSISLNVYTDKALYDKDCVWEKEETKLYINGNIITLNNKTYGDKGVFMIPAEEVFQKLGYTVFVNEKTYTFRHGGTTLTVTDGDENISFGGKIIKAEAVPTVKNNDIYIPFTLLDSFNLITVYNESGAKADIYSLNEADGTGDAIIPENAKVIKVRELIADADGWTNDKTAKFSRKDGVLRFGEDTSGKLNVLAYEREKMPENAMLEFDYRWNTNAYASIVIRCTDPQVIPWRVRDKDAYFITIKDEVIEVQKRIGNNQAFILDSVPNTQLKKDVWHAVSVGAVTNDDGSVRIVINSDGKNIVDVLDRVNYSLAGTTRNIVNPSYDPIKQDGYFSFGIFANNFSGAYAEIR